MSRTVGQNKGCSHLWSVPTNDVRFYANMWRESNQSLSRKITSTIKYLIPRKPQSRPSFAPQSIRRPFSLQDPNRPRAHRPTLRAWGVLECRCRSTTQLPAWSREQPIKYPFRTESLRLRRDAYHGRCTRSIGTPRVHLHLLVAFQFVHATKPNEVDDRGDSPQVETNHCCDRFNPLCYLKLSSLSDFSQIHSQLFNGRRAPI